MGLWRTIHAAEPRAQSPDANRRFNIRTRIKRLVHHEQRPTTDPVRRTLVKDRFMSMLASHDRLRTQLLASRPDRLN